MYSCPSSLKSDTLIAIYDSSWIYRTWMFVLVTFMLNPINPARYKLFSIAACFLIVAGTAAILNISSWERQTQPLLFIFLLSPNFARHNNVNASLSRGGDFRFFIVFISALVITTSFISVRGYLSAFFTLFCKAVSHNFESYLG